jgi:PucR C-terminal helix-turn-helix domain
VRAQLAPLERLGPACGVTAIRTLAAYLDRQGSIVRTARVLHLHRNAVTYRLRRITGLLGVDLDDPVSASRCSWPAAPVSWPDAPGQGTDTRHITAGTPALSTGMARAFPA